MRTTERQKRGWRNDFAVKRELRNQEHVKGEGVRGGRVSFGKGEIEAKKAWKWVVFEKRKKAKKKLRGWALKMEKKNGGKE